jgi:predicted PurR-regulated permease PerM
MAGTAGRNLRESYASPLILSGALLALWGLLIFAPVLAHIFFLGFFSIVLASILDIPISLLASRMPRWAASLIVLLLLLMLLVGIFWLAVPVLIDQSGQIADQASQALGRINEWWSRISDNRLLEPLIQDEAELARRIRSIAGKLAAKAIPLAFGTATIVVEAFAVLFVAVFLAYQPGAYLAILVRLFPLSKEPVVTSVLHAMGKSLRGWSLGILASMFIIGLVTGLGLWLIGIEGWITLAVVAFFGEFIPYAGPILAAVPAVAVGLADSPRTALWVALLYLGIQQLEGHLVQPLVMRQAVHIRPAVLVLWQLAFALGFGFIGLLVATPLLAVLQAAIARGYVEGWLGRNRESGGKLMDRD